VSVFFFQAEDGIRDRNVTGVQTCALPISRPTSDKVKESLFNSLGQFFQGGNVLDLYAGSGALGIEAVSRGCDHASLVDINHAACTIIKKNVALTKEERSEEHTSELQSRFDLVCRLLLEKKKNI